MAELDPSANVHDAAVGTNLTITFDQLINGATANLDTVAVHTQRGRLPASDGTVGTIDQIVVVNPDDDFFAGEIVQVSATSGIQNEVGVPATPYVWQFRTATAAASAEFRDSGQNLGDHGSHSVSLGDLDGDGDLDAFIANALGNRVWLNDGTGVFVDSGQSLGNQLSYESVLADVDGDGDLDAFAANAGANRVWLNAGDATFTDSGQAMGTSTSRGVSLGDVDGDGDLDAWLANLGQADRLWINTGGVFADSGQSFGSHLSAGVALGDFDQDGDLDAFVANDEFQGNRVWLGDGSGTFTDSGQSLGDHSSNRVTLGDIDNDGDLDAFVTNGNEGNQRWINTDSVFSSIEVFGNAGRRGSLGDLDGDADLDVFIANGGSQGNPVWINDGTGQLENSNQSLGNHSSSDVALGDLDGDGDLDAFVTNLYQRNLVWLNGPPPPPPVRPLVSISVAEPQIIELGGTTAATISLSEVTTVDVVVDLQFGGSATAQDDYLISATQLAIPAGSLSGLVSITSVADELFEPDETILIDIEGVLNGDEDGVQQGVTLIPNDDLPPLVTLAVENPVIPEAGDVATFTVTLSAPSGLETVIDLGFTGGATLFDDYTPPASPQIVLPPGVTSGSVSVTSLQDELDEHDETIVVDISLAVNAEEVGVQQQVATIIDDDALPPLSIGVDNATLSEDGDTATFTATLGEISGRDVLIDLTSIGSATLGADFTATGSQIVIAEGTTSGSVSVTTLQDELEEIDETIQLEFDVDHAELSGPSVLTSTIIDDDRPPLVRLELDSPTIVEGGGLGTFTVVLATAYTEAVTVQLGVSGTATPISDFFTANPQVTIAAGNTTADFAVIAVQDNLVEPNETVEVEILSVVNGFEDGDQRQTVTIVDDDSTPFVTLAVEAPEILELDGTTTFTASLSAPFNRDVTVDLSFDGTATLGTDYSTTSTRIVVPAGSTGGSITVAAADDLLDEPNETIIVEIVEVTNGVEVGEQQEVTTIVDDDVPPTVTLAVDTDAVAEFGSATLTATSSWPFGVPVTVELAFSGNAAPGTDFIYSATEIVIPPGTTTASVRLTATQDTLDEPDEDVIVDIVGVTNGTESGTQQVSFAILDDDEAPSVTLAADVTFVAEQSGIAGFTATLSEVSAKDVTIDLALSGTAQRDLDYLASGTQLVIPAGNVSGTFNIIAFQDAIDEVDETVVVDIASVTNGFESGEQFAVAVIVDDDAPPSVSLTLDLPTISEAGGLATFTAQLSEVSGKDVTVDLGVDGTAAPTIDFNLSGTQLTILAGESSGSVEVAALQDVFVEDDETVEVSILAVVNGNEAGEQVRITTIEDDDDLPQVTLAVDNSEIGENDGVAIVTANLSAPSLTPVTVNLSITSTATPEEDFVHSGTQIVIPAGATAGSITVSAVDDSLDEADETVTVEVTSVTNATLSSSQTQVITILDDEEPPQVSLTVNSTTIPEAAGIAAFTVSLSQVSSLDVTVDLSLSGTATASIDYLSTTTQLMIPAGTTTGTLTVITFQDTFDEEDESVVVDIAAVVNALESGVQQEVVTITDDDEPPVVTLSLDTATIPENGGAANLTAALSSPSGRDITVNLTFAGTATPGDDYSTSATQILVPAGAPSASITLNAIQDTLLESDEQVTIEVDSVLNATELGNQSQTLTILDDDASPEVTLSVDPSSISEAGGVATVVASLVNPAPAAVVIDLELSGTATNGSDYVLSATQIQIAPGGTSGVVTVTALQDVIDEPDETVFLDITAVQGGTAANQQASVTIVDDDPSQPLVTLSVDPAVIAETDGSAVITATLSSPATQPVTVSLGISGSATLGSDFTIDGTQIVIPVGSTSGSVPVNALTDTAFEGDESIIADVVDVANALEQTTQQVVITIRDDNVPTLQLLWNTTLISENNGTAELTAVLSGLAGVPGVPVTVDLGFTGSATHGSDFTAATQLVIPPGNLNTTISVAAVQDVLYEGSETIIAEVIAITNANELGEQRETITIADDDVPPSVTLAVHPPSIAEGGGQSTITAALSSVSGLPVTVDLAYTGSASFGTDFSAPTQLVIPAGDGNATATIDAVADQVNEGNETIVVRIATATNASVFGTQERIVNIVDGDQPRLEVTSLEPTSTGFVAEFSGDVDTSTLNLYDTESAGMGPADVLLVGETTGTVVGSLVVDAALGTMTFVKSGGPLTPDIYTVTLRSGANGIRTTGGILLADGDDYVDSFQVTAAPANGVTVSVPDFMRGPGQAVNVPADSNNGIPLTISEAEHARAIELVIAYDPALLTISGAVLGPDVPSDATIAVNTATPGSAVVQFSSSAALPTGPITFASLLASVPSSEASAIYGEQQVLDLHSVTVRDSGNNEIPAVADDALHVSSFFGDASANGRINASDAAQVARFAALIGTGFGSLPNTDPLIVGDISGNGRLNALDASLVARFAALIDVPEIPAIPAGVRISGGESPVIVPTAFPQQVGISEQSETPETVVTDLNAVATGEAHSGEATGLREDAVDELMERLRPRQIKSFDPNDFWNEIDF